MSVPPSLSILVPSVGRGTLGRTVHSILGQIAPGDELIVDVNDDSPWGNEARERMTARARGDFVLFIDDDDYYLPGAFEQIRQACQTDPEAMYVFRGRWSDGRVLWQSPVVAMGNVSTQLVAVPRAFACEPWGRRYEGDYDYIAAVASKTAVTFDPSPIVAVFPRGGS
jgi:hypothetical protein